MKNGLMTMLLASALLIPAVAASAAGVTMSRADVVEVQQVLADAGFYRAGVDGLWGPQTAAALRSYQASNGIAATGRMDLATVNEMGFTVRGDAYRYGSYVPDRYDTSVTYGREASAMRYRDGRPVRGDVAADADAAYMNLYMEPAAGTPTMRAATPTYYNMPVAAPLGDSEIQALQQALRDSGYFMKEPVNGMWTPYTVTALRSYQIDKGMSGSGIPDVETLQRLGLQIQSSDKLVTRTVTAR